MANAATNAQQRPYEIVYDLLKRSLETEAESAELVIAIGPLAQQFSTSRSPVERAVRMLADEGLLRPAKNGRYIRPPIKRSGKQPVVLELETVVKGLPGQVRDLARQATWQRIYDEVEQELVAYMPFGTYRLKESALAEYIGVSRTVSNSVLSRLEERGVVSRNANGRWQIKQLTQNELANIYQLRRLLEPPALLESALLLPAANLDEALQRLAEAESDPAELDSEGARRIEHDLHNEALSYCKNTRMLDLIRRSQILHVATTYMPNQSASMEERRNYLAEHRMVFECLAVSRHELAAHALGEHIAASLDRAALRLERAARSPAPKPADYLAPI